MSPTLPRLAVLLLLLGAAGLVAPGVARAASGDAASLSARIEQRYEAGAAEALSRFLKPRDFHVSAAVEAKAEAADTGGAVGYLPRSAQGALIETLDFRLLRERVTRVSLDVMLDARYDQKSQERFRQILIKTLKLTAGIDQVSFASLDIARPDDVLPQAGLPQLGQTGAQNPQDAKIAAQLEVVRGQLEDTRRQLTVAEAAKGQSETLVKRLEAQIDRLRTMGAAGEDDESDAAEGTKPAATEGASKAEKSSLERWLIPLVAALATIALTVVGLGLVSAFRKIGGDLGSGLDALGKSVAGGGIGAGAAPTVEAPVGAAKGEASSSVGGTLVPAESMDGVGQVYARLNELHREVLLLLDEHSEILVLRWVSALLADDATVAKAVVTLELFGAEKANALFKKLGPSEQAQILKFLRIGITSGPKARLMLEAGEDLKTRLLALGADAKVGEVTRRLHAELLKASDSELVKAVTNMGDGALARLLMHLEPVRTGRVMASLAQENPAVLQRVVAQVGFIADAASRVEHDKEILDALKLAVGGDDSTGRKFYVSYYTELLESVDEGLGEQIVKSLANDPMLKERVVRRHITAGALFGMEPELRGEIVAALPAKELAGWLSTLPNEQRQVVLATLTEKRREIVLDDLNQIDGSASLKRKAKRSAATVRSRIVKSLRDMQASGEWQPGQAAKEPLQATAVPAPTGQDEAA